MSELNEKKLEDEVLNIIEEMANSECLKEIGPLFTSTVETANKMLIDNSLDITTTRERCIIKAISLALLKNIIAAKIMESIDL